MAKEKVESMCAININIKTCGALDVFLKAMLRYNNHYKIAIVLGQVIMVIVEIYFVYTALTDVDSVSKTISMVNFAIVITFILLIRNFHYRTNTSQKRIKRLLKESAIIKDDQIHFLKNTISQISDEECNSYCQEMTVKTNELVEKAKIMNML